ncbi:hypothetical protein NXV73_00820 [Bacteroides salyersiae]|nr:hypothetical protein [Bacteroides salyersiae]
MVRVNAFILTNGEYKGEFPANVDICGYKVFFRVIDLRYLYQITVESRVPIEINFKEEGYTVPCLSAASENPDYQAYVAIIPGNLFSQFI